MTIGPEKTKLAQTGYQLINVKIMKESYANYNAQKQYARYFWWDVNNSDQYSTSSKHFRVLLDKKQVEEILALVPHENAMDRSRIWALSRNYEKAHETLSAAKIDFEDPKNQFTKLELDIYAYKISKFWDGASIQTRLDQFTPNEKNSNSKINTLFSADLRAGFTYFTNEFGKYNQVEQLEYLRKIEQFDLVNSICAELLKTEKDGVSKARLQLFIAESLFQKGQIAEAQSKLEAIDTKPLEPWLMRNDALDDLKLDMKYLQLKLNQKQNKLTEEQFENLDEKYKHYPSIKLVQANYFFGQERYEEAMQICYEFLKNTLIEEKKHSETDRGPSSQFARLAISASLKLQDPFRAQFYINKLEVLQRKNEVEQKLNKEFLVKSKAELASWKKSNLLELGNCNDSGVSPAPKEKTEEVEQPGLLTRFINWIAGLLEPVIKYLGLEEIETMKPVKKKLPYHELIAQGIEQKKSGNIMEAIQTFQEAIEPEEGEEENRADFYANYQLAQIFFQLHQYQKAYENCESALPMLGEAMEEYEEAAELHLSFNDLRAKLCLKLAQEDPKKSEYKDKLFDSLAEIANKLAKKEAGLTQREEILYACALLRVGQNLVQAAEVYKAIPDGSKGKELEFLITKRPETAKIASPRALALEKEQERSL